VLQHNSPESIYNVLAGREVRQSSELAEEKIVRGGFEKHDRPVRILDGLESEVIIPRSQYFLYLRPEERGVPIITMRSFTTRFIEVC
jgi:hypothetical protein